MQLDLLPTLEPGLYPSQSEHQREIETHFGAASYRELRPEERSALEELDIFLVCFTNRCGSTLLTEMMNQVGFGIPPRVEVFNADLLIASCEHDGVESFTRYFYRACTGWQSRGQVGFKIGAQQLFWLTRTGLLSHFRQIRLINSRRRDAIGQAVSLYVALQTGQWHSEMDGRSDTAHLPYSRNEILRCLKSIHEGQQLIHYYANIHDLPVLRVDYEDSLTQPAVELAKIAEFLGRPELAEVPIDTDAIAIKQQRNEDSERLAAQFREEFSAPGRPGTGAASS